MTDQLYRLECENCGAVIEVHPQIAEFERIAQDAMATAHATKCGKQPSTNETPAARNRAFEEAAQIADTDAALGRQDLDDPEWKKAAGGRVLAGERIASAIRDLRDGRPNELLMHALVKELKG